MTKEEQERIIERENIKTEYRLMMAVYSVIFTNDIANSLIVDMMPPLKRSKFYKQQTKKAVNELEREAKAFDKKLRTVGKENIDFLLDSTDNMADTLHDDIVILQACVHREFSKARIEDSALFAKVEVARIMTDFAYRIVDWRIEELKKESSLVRRMEWMKPSDVLKRIDRLCDMIYPKVYVNLNDSQDCKNAMKAIQKNLSNASNIVHAITEADKDLQPIKELTA